MAMFPLCVARGNRDQRKARRAIVFLISAMALPGLRPFGQVRVQFMIV